MEPPEDLIRCIYCQEYRRPSWEHVLQRSIGGDLTRPILCHPCNGELSPIDQALAERSLVSLSRVAFTPPSAFKTQLGFETFHNDSDSGLTLDVVVLNEMRPEILPQVHVARAPNDRWQFAEASPNADGLQRLRAFVGDRVAAGTLRSLHVKIGPEAAGPTARIVLHRKDDAFVRVPQGGDPSELFEVIETRWTAFVEGAPIPSSPKVETTEQPRITVVARMRPDDTNRAVAKIAFNVLATRIGVDFAHSPEFDVLRNYIRGLDIRHGTAAPDAVLVDERFVRMLPRETEPLVPTEEHAVTITYASGALWAFVTLYKHHHFLVRLGDIALPDEVFATHEFSTVRKGNAALDYAELFRRLRSKIAP